MKKYQRQEKISGKGIVKQEELWIKICTPDNTKSKVQLVRWWNVSVKHILTNLKGTILWLLRRNKIKAKKKKAAVTKILQLSFQKIGGPKRKKNNNKGTIYQISLLILQYVNFADWSYIHFLRADFYAYISRVLFLSLMMTSDCWGIQECDQCFDIWKTAR